ncbi:MAG: hypothetical protein WBR28_00395 [Mycobacterium sp.]
MHSWPDEFDYSPFPENLSIEQLQSHITEILHDHHALEVAHSEELVRRCRAIALKFEAHGLHGNAQEWRNYANSLSEAAAVRSEVADKLRAHFENTNGG